MSRVMMTTRMPSMASTTAPEKFCPYLRNVSTECTRTTPATSSRLATIAYSTPMMIHLTIESALSEWRSWLLGSSATVGTIVVGHHRGRPDWWSQPFVPAEAGLPSSDGRRSSKSAPDPEYGGSQRRRRALLNGDLPIPFGHLAAAQRNHLGQQSVARIKARDFGEGTLRAESHATRRDVVFCAVP